MGVTFDERPVIPKIIVEPPQPDDDIVKQVVGDFGRWQLRTIILIFLCKIPSSWFMAAVIYTAPSPKKGDYFCRPPMELSNNTQDWIQIAHPTTERKTDKEFDVDFCHVREDSVDKKIIEKHKNFQNPFLQPLQNSTNIIPCNQFDYKTEYKSLITDFDLVCSKQLLVSLTQCFHSLGTLLGGLLAVHLIEILSPKQLMLFGMIFQIVCGNLTGLVNTFPLHVFFRCITAAFCAFMYTGANMIFTDITHGRAKTMTLAVFELFWSVGLILLPGISIFVDNWSYLYVAISSPTILMLFTYKWIADSPRWLLRKGRTDAAVVTLLQSAAFNNRDIPLDIENRLKNYSAELRKPENMKKIPYFTIWDGQTERSYILAVHMAWIWSVMLYNAMVLNIRAFGVDHIHVNTVIVGFAEMIGVLVGTYLVLYTRRRWFYIGILTLVTGVATFFIWTVPNTLAETKRVGLDMMFCIGMKLSNAASMVILTSCTAEMVTSEKRVNLMFSVSTASRIGLVFAPFIVSLAIIQALVPITIFAALACFSGLFMWFIDGKFYDRNISRIARVPTINTFRKKTAQILAERRISDPDNLGIEHDPAQRVSINDIWATKTETSDGGLKLNGERRPSDDSEKSEHSARSMTSNYCDNDDLDKISVRSDRSIMLAKLRKIKKKVAPNEKDLQELEKQKEDVITASELKVQKNEVRF